MADWLFKEIPVYKIYLGWVGLLLLLVIVGSIFNLSPYHMGKARANIFKTRADEKFFVFMLKNQLANIGLVASNEFVLSSIPVQYNLEFATNNAGALIDLWQTPYKIEIVQQTNLIIHSAGPNHKFGDADDIIFNSASNDFVKP